MKRASLASLSLVLTIACGSDSTVRPPTTPTSTNPTLLSLSVQGPSKVPPGQTAQAKAVARFSDGSERDVTADARWSSVNSRVASAAAGMLTGLALGRTIIFANYPAKFASLTIVVEPDGTFIVRGNVTEPGNVVVESAAVEVLSGQPSQVTTNSVGFYELFGVSGTVTLRVSKQGYVDDTRTLTVTQDQTQDVQIKPRSQPAAVTGIYSMTITASSPRARSCRLKRRRGPIPRKSRRMWPGSSSRSATRRLSLISTGCTTRLRERCSAMP